MISAREALARLREGNRRFASGVRSSDILASETRRNELATGQEPFAIISRCSDSRVPAEIVFDHGLGDCLSSASPETSSLPPQIGSVEFAAERFGTPLVVVLGHSRCGAVLATLEELMRPRGARSRNLRSIVDRNSAIRGSLTGDRIHNTTRRLSCGTPFAAMSAPRKPAATRIGSPRCPSFSREQLLVVGAEYSLETGVVDFFDGVPEAG
jgi:carbonic anhydrase